jgi:type IV pilus assembly protein PilY1
MKMKINQARRSVAAAALVAAFLVPSQSARTEDDTALFSVNVPPNVMIIIDNSGSMNELVWHPDFNPATTYSCTGFTADQSFNSASKTWTMCSKTRTLYSDPQVTTAGQLTRVSKEYLNWIFSLPNGDARLTEINVTGNGTYTPCLQAQGFTTFSKYRRARVSAAKDVLREVICNVNQASAVRFGLAEFRMPGGDGDPNGGYVRVPIKDYNAPSYSLQQPDGTFLTATHQGHLTPAIQQLEGETWTPLGETLFQIYTYFMSRTASNRPKGVNGTTFPGYVYRTNPTGNYGSYTSTAANIPEDPVQFDCQKNFVVLITDGEPTKDDFDNSNSGDNTGQGFGSFTGLIGNYNNDGETEIQGADCVNNPVSDECALYLDDIAKFMQNNDFRPDKPGTQVVDVYTVGFTTTPQANDLLARTAAQGNGLFSHSNNAEELSQAIVGAISDIVQKSQSFTAATVPATRTADGGNIYTSLFLPQNNNPFWEGHLKLFNITSDGDILDASGNCALVNPTPVGECKGGAISQTAPPYWDAAEEIPAPVSRSLYTTMPSGSTQVRVPFDTTLPLSGLGDPAVTTDDLTTTDIAQYPGSGATTAIGLKDAIVQNVRGCELGTGVTNACVTRPWLLGDIFHSNPLVVGEPRSFVPEASYFAFAAAHATRDKMIYAGANDGFLHGFLGGTWDATPPVGEQPSYDRGTGAEIFGFMPWPARRNIRNLPRDGGNRDFYYVDGSPAAADVWTHSTATQTAKAANGSEWSTVLAGGLRQGGRAYYAIDVTDPSAAGYPQYLWEFPKEGAAAATTSYMGETWGLPIVTKVKVVISGVAYERWVAIVTGGYDKTGDPNDPVNYNASATAGRAIFVVDMKTGGILAQKKFTAAASDATSQMRYAIPSTPAVLDLDGDEFADVIYVGDLGGNVWKWVVSYDPVHDNYGVDPINSSGSVDQPNWKFTNFFQAKTTASASLGVTIGTTNYYKSIFFPPAATYKSGSLWLTFATGERTNLKRGGDATTTAENNRFYSVVDADALERSGPYAAMNESTLLDSTDDGSCASLSGFTGYFFRARDAEKFVTNVDIFAYQVIAASYMPTDTTGNPCSSAGSATLYVFRVYCGEGFFGGTDGAARRLDLGAGMPTDPRITVSPTGTRVVVTQQDGEIENRDGPPIDPEKLGQLYWREVTD